MSSKELTLEILLNNLNSKLVFYDKILKKIPTKFFKIKFFNWKIQPLKEKRDQAFRELRELMRKKHPEIFIGGNYD